MPSTEQAACDTDSDDDLPAGWDERVALDGRVFYACHMTRTTQWTHPTTGKRKKVAGELPYGWEQQIAKDGYAYYVDRINNKSTMTDPRLAFAVEDKDPDRSGSATVASISDMKQKYDAYTAAATVLAGRDLSGRYALVTGANGGIGFETARALALQGCHVVLACRNTAEAKLAVDRIVAERSTARAVAMHVDLAKLRSVKALAAEYTSLNWPLHMLILNAAVFSPPYECTEDGFELTFQVNHLGHYYLTRLLEPVLMRSAPSRIVVVSSESHRFNPFFHGACDVTLDTFRPDRGRYRGMLAYNLSKLCNVAFSNELDRRLASYSVRSNAVHPGNLVATSMPRHWWGYRLLFAIVRPFTKSLQQAAATAVYAATSRDLEGIGGMYFNNCWFCTPSVMSSDRDFCTTLWSTSERAILERMGQFAFSVPEPAAAASVY